MNEMQNGRMAQRIRDSKGTCVSSKQAMPEMVANVCKVIVSLSGVTEQGCARYLKSLSLLLRVRAAFPLL